MRYPHIKPAGWLALVFLASFLMLWTINNPKEPKSKLGRPLRVGVAVWPGYAGGIYANSGFKATKESIFWSDCNHLLVEFAVMGNGKQDREIAFTPFTPGKPNGKQFDVVWSTVDYSAEELPRLRRQGIEARVFLQVDWSRGGDAIIADSKIESIRDLKGKIVALDWHGPSGWLLASTLKTAGLTKNDVIIRDTQDPKKAGRNFEEDDKVAAAVLWEPYITEMLDNQRRSCKVLLSTSSAANLIADVLVARKDFIDQHREVLEDFCRCWLKGAHDINQNPARAVKPLLAGFKSIPESPFTGEGNTRRMLNLIAAAGQAENAEMFGLLRANKHPLFDSIFTQARDLMSDDRVFRPDDAKDTSILEKLISPRPQPVDCKNTENIKPVLAQEIALDLAAGNNTPAGRQARLDELATTALTYSQACISLEGPQAREAKLYLADHYKFDETRFVTKPNGNRGLVYVLPDAEVKARTQRENRDID